MASLALQKLKNDLVVMAEMCENALDTAIMGLLDRDEELACYVIDYDHEIDAQELAIDQQCLTLLGDGTLRGDDLRLVVSAAKINNDLERIGDLAVGICEHVLFLVRERSVLSQVLDLQEELNQVSQMVRESVDALVTRDVDLAWKIIDERPIVAEEMGLVFQEVLDLMRHEARTIERGCHILFISQNLMRVADKASDVAEEVIFAVEGVEVRHRLAEFRSVAPLPFAGEGERLPRQAETDLLRRRRSREEARQVREETRRATKRLTREEVTAAATEGKEKAARAREKLLALRAKNRSAPPQP